MTDSQEDLSPGDEALIRRLFSTHPPLALDSDWESDLRAAMSTPTDPIAGASAPYQHGHDSPRAFRSGQIAAAVESPASPDETANGGAEVIALSRLFTSWHRPARRLVVQAAVLAMLIAGAVTVAIQARDIEAIDTAGSTMPSTVAPPSSGQTEALPGSSQTRSSVVEGVRPPVFPSAGTDAGVEEYPIYVTVKDQTGSIAIDVPDEWAAEVELGPGANGLPSLIAVSSLTRATTPAGEFFDDLTGAGVVATVFSTPREPSDVLDEVKASGVTGSCESPKSSEFSIPYEGRLEVFANCPNNATLAYVAVVDRAAGLAALVILQGFTPKDLGAFDNVVGSLVLTDNFGPETVTPTTPRVTPTPTGSTSTN